MMASTSAARIGSSSQTAGRVGLLVSSTALLLRGSGLPGAVRSRITEHSLHLAPQVPAEGDVVTGAEHVHQATVVPFLLGAALLEAGPDGIPYAVELVRDGADVVKLVGGCHHANVVEGVRQV